MGALADTLRNIFKSNPFENEEEEFFKAKKPSKEEMIEMGIDEDDLDDVYAEGVEEDFDEENEEDKDEEDTEDEDAEEDKENEEDNEERETQSSIKKSDAISSLMSDQSVLEDAQIALIKEHKRSLKEIEFLKSEIDSLKRSPENLRNPVFTKSQTQTQNSLGSSTIKAQIKKGISEGKLSASDMLAFEGSRRQTQNVKNYMNMENK